jgi:hypothetical protein
MMPGTDISFGRSALIVSSTESSRSARGFIAENRYATLLSVENATAFSTPGSDCRMSATAFCRAAMASNEMSCPAIVTPKMNPLSWLGMKPVGIVIKR